MNLFGYSTEARKNGTASPTALAEVTLLANPAELRAMAAFL
jgi:hypothetical protein